MFWMMMMLNAENLNTMMDMLLWTALRSTGLMNKSEQRARYMPTQVLPAVIHRTTQDFKQKAVNLQHSIVQVNHYSSSHSNTPLAPPTTPSLESLDDKRGVVLRFPILIHQLVSLFRSSFINSRHHCFLTHFFFLFLLLDYKLSHTFYFNLMTHFSHLFLHYES
jgi:hypothetical protein